MQVDQSTATKPMRESDDAREYTLPLIALARERSERLEEESPVVLFDVLFECELYGPVPRTRRRFEPRLGVNDGEGEPNRKSS